MLRIIFVCLIISNSAIAIFAQNNFQEKFIYHSYDYNSTFGSFNQPQFQLIDSFTFEYFYKGCTDDIPVGLYYFLFFEFNYNYKIGFEYWKLSSSGTFQINHNGVHTAYGVSPQPSVNLDTVFHIALTFHRGGSTGYARFYFNGFFTHEIPIPWSYPTYNSLPVRLGGKSGEYNLPGYYDQFRVSRGLRYSQNFTPPDSIFGDSTTLAIWNFDNPSNLNPLFFIDSISSSHLYSYGEYHLLPNIDHSSSITSPDTVCIGDSLKIIGTLPHAQYSWYPGSIFIDSTSSSPIIAVDDTAIAVILTISDSMGCYTLTDTVYLYVPPIPSYQLSGDTMICKGDTTSINVTTNENFQWISNLSLSDTLSYNPVVYPTNSEKYFLRINYFNQCTIRDSISVLVSSPIPQVNTDTVLCFGDTILATALGGITYSWQPLSDIILIASDSALLFPTTSTNYNLFAFDSLGCKASTTFKIYVSQYALNLGPDTTVCEPLLLSQPGFMSYNWSNGDTGSTMIIDSSNIYFLQVTDSLGCLSSDSINVTIQILSPLFIEARDHICDNDSVYIKASNQNLVYTWWPGSNFSDSTIVSPIFLPGTLVDSVSLIGEDSNTGCTQTANKKFIKTVDCVWPGDANNDGIVNNFDVLVIGASYGFSDSLLIRENASFFYRGQYASFHDTTSSGINYKFINTNGDTLIDYNDTGAVSLNYSLTHNKNNFQNSFLQSGPPLYIDHSDSVSTNNRLVIPMYLGTNMTSAIDIYGIAFTLHYNGPIDDNTIKVTLNDAWFLNDFSFLTLQKHFPQQQKIELAIVRTDKKDTTGFGKIMDLELDLISINNSSTLQFSFSNVNLINKNLNEQQVQVINKNIFVSTIELQHNQKLIEIYPNPASDKVNFKINKSTTGKIYIFNTQGQNIEELEILPNIHNYTLDISHLPNGMYIISNEENNIILDQQKFIILR